MKPNQKRSKKKKRSNRQGSGGQVGQQSTKVNAQKRYPLQTNESNSSEPAETAATHRKKQAHRSVSERSKNRKMTTLKSTQIFSPIRQIRDGIIITKDGSFIKLMEFSSINFMLRNDAEKDNIIADYASVIRLLPKNVQFKVISRKADISEFIEKIQEDMSSEPSPDCRKLQREQINLIRDVGTRQAISRRFLVAFRYEDDSSADKHTEWSDIKSSLNTTAMRIESAMYRMGNELVSDESNEYTLEILYSLLCRSQSESVSFHERIRDNITRFIVGSSGGNSTTYLPVNDLIAPGYIDTRDSKYMVVDGLYYAFAYVPSASFPKHATAGWTSLFTNLGEGIDMDLYLTKQDVRSMQIKLQYALRMNKIQLRSTEDTSLDYEEKQDTVSSGYYLKDGMSAGDDFCYMNLLLTVIGRSKDELMAKCEELKQYCFTLDMPIKMANFQHEQAFLSTLPICQLDKNLFSKSKRNILGSDFASTYPFSSYEVSDENGILLGINQSNNSLVFVDNFDASKYVNPNWVLLGTSGAGKTYTLQCIASRMRERKIQVFIIAPEKGPEFKRMCDALGGAYIKISTGAKHNINIMEIRKKDRANTILLDGEETEECELVQKIQQLHIFFSLLVPDITHEEKQLLDEAMIKTYSKYGITNDNNSLIDPAHPDQYKEMPILGDLYDTLLEHGARTQRISTILTRFVSGSASSFNRRTNVNLDNKYVVLDITSLTKELLPMGMFIVLDYVWDKAREDRTKKKAIIIDEVWKLIGPFATPQSAEFVLDIFKLIRGYGGCAVASTQDLNDFYALEEGRYSKGIINSSRIKFILRLETKEALSVQDTIGLTDAEVSECARFEPGEGILLANSNHVIVKVKASQFENTLITTRREELAEIAQSLREKG